jgi:hypothetical protein
MRGISSQVYEDIETTVKLEDGKIYFGYIEKDLTILPSAWDVLTDMQKTVIFNMLLQIREHSHIVIDDCESCINLAYRIDKLMGRFINLWHRQDFLGEDL